MEDLSLKEAKLIKRLSRLWQPQENESPLASPEAFSAVYEQNYLAVFRYLYGLCGGPQEDIEDLTAETFAHAWKARHTFRGKPKTATGWLLSIARHLVIDTYRRNQVRIQPQETLPEDPAPEETARWKPTPENLVIADEQRWMLLAMLQTLPDEPREMLVLRYLLNWRVRQIAEYLGIPENTATVTIRRALERLQRQWPQEKE